MYPELAGDIGRSNRVSALIQRPSPHWSSREGNAVSMVIIHGTGSTSDEGTLSWLQDPRSKVSYHYLIGLDGKIYQCVAEQHKAWHAGRSTWHGREIAGSVNPISVGIALTSDGSEPYTWPQYDSLANLLTDVMARYRIPPNDVRGHNEVAPGRKVDPYNHFDWRAVLGMVGER